MKRKKMMYREGRTSVKTRGKQSSATMEELWWACNGAKRNGGCKWHLLASSAGGGLELWL